MKAIVYKTHGEAGVTEIEPREPGPREALIRTRASGICHTDIEILHGRYGNSTFPLVPGHEYAGTVEAVGSDVTEFSTGDRVVIDPNFGCGQCRACRKGQTNLCENLGAYGVTVNGGFAEFSTVAVENLVKIGEMPFEIAALAEPMGCVLNGVEAIGTEDADEALVFGAGPIGVLMAMALRTRGVGSIGLVDIDEGRLELAASFGFSALASGSEALAARQGAMDIAIDATGVAAVAANLVRYAVNGGKVLYFGVCPPDATIEISPFEVFRRQLTLAGAHSLNHNIPSALAAIEAVGPEIGRLVSHKVPLAHISDFLLGQSRQKTLKVQAVL